MVEAFAGALLRMEQEELAAKAGIARATLNDYEAEKRTPRSGTLVLIRDALEGAGIIFSDGDEPGVRLAKRRGKKR
jgi:transcriptional regulator with XRE-family HTH domain